MKNLVKEVASYLALLLIAISGGVIAAPTVSGIDLLSEKRISRTVFEYTYRVNVLGDTVDYEQVSATLTAVGAGTTIVSATAALGSVAALTPKASSTTVAVRHDRTLPFDATAVRWSVTGQSKLERGALLGGEANSPAYQYTLDLDTRQTYPQSEYENVSGTRVLRTVVGIGYRESATVGEINDMLQRVGGRIIYSLKATSMLYVRIPDPGSFDALQAKISQIKGESSVDIVQTMVSPQTELVLGNFVPPYVPLSSELWYSTLIGTKASVAWNAKRALLGANLQGLDLLIVDEFGGGMPNQALHPMFTIKNGTDCGFATVSNPSSHGYGVLGIIGASHSDIITATGMFPSNASILPPPPQAPPFGLVTVDLKYSSCNGEALWMPRLARAIIDLTSQGRNVVVNSSLGSKREYINNYPQSNEVDLQAWLKLIRPVGREGIDGPVDHLTPNPIVENRYFHSTAAGNVDSRFPNISDARDSGGIQRAAIDQFLHNTAVVENRMVSNLGAFGTPRCLNPGEIESKNMASFTNGNISAIGSTPYSEAKGLVWYTGALGTTAIIDNGGTSSAAPQVAGLALYLWALRPTLTSESLWKIIKTNTIDIPGCAGQHLIDAYATVLSADNPNSLNVRRAILDVNEDGFFNITDVQQYLEIFKSNPNKNYLSVSNPNVSLSRYDLNGDGWISTTKTARFNLDMDYGGNFESLYGTVKSTIEDRVISFNELAVSDLQILCYYAYSPLYSGDNSARTEALAELCAPVNDFCVTPLPAKYLSTGLASGQTSCTNGNNFTFNEVETSYTYLTGNNVNGRNLLAEGRCAEDTSAQTLYGTFDPNYHNDGALGRITFSVPTWGLSVQVVRTAENEVKRTSTQQYADIDENGASIICTNTSTYKGNLTPITPPPEL